MYKVFTLFGYEHWGLGPDSVTSFWIGLSPNMLWTVPKPLNPAKSFFKGIAVRRNCMRVGSGASSKRNKIIIKRIRSGWSKYFWTCLNNLSQRQYSSETIYQSLGKIMACSPHIRSKQLYTRDLCYICVAYNIERRALTADYWLVGLTRTYTRFFQSDWVINRITESHSGELRANSAAHSSLRGTATTTRRRIAVWSYTSRLSVCGRRAGSSSHSTRVAVSQAWSAACWSFVWPAHGTGSSVKRPCITLRCVFR